MKLTKKNLGLATAVAGLLLVTGCRDRGEQNQTAMQSAEQSAERAAEQQDKAADKAEDAASARQDVKEEREDLKEAQAEAQQATAEAQQAQQQAQQQGAQAERQMGQADQQAMGGAGQPGMGSEQTAQGALVRASDDEIVLRTEGAEGELKLKVSDSTPVTIDGREGKISDLKEGTQVRASYAGAEGERTATRIEAQENR